MSRTHLLRITFVACAIVTACYRRHDVALTCTPPARRGTGFQRRIVASGDTVRRPVTFSVKSIDRTSVPLPMASLRWASINSGQFSAIPRVHWDSALFRPVAAPPGTYIVQVLALGYQRIEDTLVLSRTAQTVEYGMWEDPVCLVETARPLSRPAA